MMTADAGGRPARPGVLDEVAEPVFAPQEGSGLYGTGHNSFFTSPDGQQTWNVYHAVTDPAGSCGSDREVYAQPSPSPPTEPRSWHAVGRPGAAALGRPRAP